MKRIGLLLATLGVVAGTCWAVRETAAFPKRGGAPAAGHRADDPLATEAGARYRQAQPTHWRDVLLTH